MSCLIDRNGGEMIRPTGPFENVNLVKWIHDDLQVSLRKSI